MSDFIEEASKISAKLRRDLTLCRIAQEWQRESWCEEENASQDETIRMLEIYQDLTEGHLNELDFQLRSLLEHLSNNARNP